MATTVADTPNAGTRSAKLEWELGATLARQQQLDERRGELEKEIGDLRRQLGTVVAAGDARAEAKLHEKIRRLAESIDGVDRGLKILQASRARVERVSRRGAFGSSPSPVLLLSGWAYRTTTSAA